MWQVLYSNALGSKPQLWLRGTLANGQCFNYSCRIDEGGAEVWTGALGSRVVKLKQSVFSKNDDGLPPVFYWTTEEDSLELRSSLDTFFRADVDLDDHYCKWSAACSRFARLAKAFRGVRIVDQEPWECLVSFITSTNNHIPRITKLLSSLRTTYGTPITLSDETLYAFPSPQVIANHATEEALRTLGFGYRAPYIIKTAKHISENISNNARWLHELRDNDIGTSDVRQRLTSLTGVGPKVADCVALFSCNRLELVPVDVHVFNIAKRDYDDEKKLVHFKTVTKPVYDIISNIFTARFGKLAGWAHSVLFMSELPTFRERLSEEEQVFMKSFKHEQQVAKRERTKSRNSDSTLELKTESETSDRIETKNLKQVRTSTTEKTKLKNKRVKVTPNI